MAELLRRQVKSSEQWQEQQQAETARAGAASVSKALFWRRLTGLREQLSLLKCDQVGKEGRRVREEILTVSKALPSLENEG